MVCVTSKLFKVDREGIKYQFEIITEKDTYRYNITNLKLFCSHGYVALDTRPASSITFQMCEDLGGVLICEAENRDDMITLAKQLLPEEFV